MDVTDRVYTAGMTEGEVEAVLREGDTGVLALASDDDAYAIPVAYHYDGETLRFRLADDGHSRKLAFADTTATATFLMYGYDGPNDSWSVLVSGSIRRLSPEEWETLAPADINEKYAPLRVFDEAVEAVELVGYELRIQEATGRRTAE